MKDFKQIAKDVPYVLIEEPDLIELLKQVDKIKPQVILEIGTRQGFSFKAFVDAFDPLIAITVDILKREEMPAPDVIPTVSNLGSYYLWGYDSQKESTLKQIKLMLDNRMVDFLFIDGDHSLETATRDWELYSPLVRKGGIVAFHDILTVTEHANGENQIQVKLLYDELKKKYRHLVINETPKDQEKLAFTTGIGLLYI